LRYLRAFDTTTCRVQLLILSAHVALPHPRHLSRMAGGGVGAVNT